MQPFEFICSSRIIFGRGQVARIGVLAAEWGRTALVVHNSGERGDGGWTDRLANLLGETDVRAVFYRQRGEPLTTHIDEAVAIGRRESVEAVIGLGGGSAIDTAKAVAGLIANGGQAIDYMEIIGNGKKISKPALPWIAVPTTAGTGAEVTRNAVVGSPERKFKASIRSEHLLARIALLDAELAVAVPRDITARCGLDALCQLIESYTSINANLMTDALAVKGISLAAASLRTAYRDGMDLDAREAMGMAALLSGITLSHAGLGAVHGFAAPLGANFPVPHGTVCGLLLPLVLEANISAMRSTSDARLSRYADIGRLLASPLSLSDEAAVDLCVSFTASLAQEFGLPSLSHFDFKESDIPEIISLARKSSSMRYNPVVLSDAALATILERARK